MITLSEYTTLVTEVNRLRNEVSLFNQEEISEFALDDLKHKITEYETAFPNNISPQSPNLVVAGGVLQGFEKFTHKRRVLSLNDIFTLDELVDWQKKWKDHLFNLRTEEPELIQQLAPSFVYDESSNLTANKQVFATAINETYIAEPKLDGMALILHYSGGKLYKAVTRGDSRVGEDVTDNIKLISGIPNYIPVTEDTEVRGELIMSKKDFESLNLSIQQGKKIGKMGKTGPEYIFANPRNAVAGTIRNLDQSIISERPMFFIAYGLFVEKN